MAKRALLIGINYVGTSSELGGCVNDAMVMKEVLVDILGFDEGDITLMVDVDNEEDSETYPTAANIKRAIEDHIGMSEDGDTLFIHYSGHGTQIPDPSGEEEDKKDEALCSADDQVILDDWLKYQFCQLSPGVKLTFVADCCHSGSLLDQPEQDLQIDGEKDEDEAVEYEDSGVEPASRSIEWDTLVAAMQEKYGDVATFMAANPFVADELAEEVDDDGNAATWAYAALNASRCEECPDTAALSNVVLITGCQDHQYSADYDFSRGEGASNGALTWALTNVLKESEELPSNRELVTKARAALAAYRGTQFDQNPRLVCPDDLADAPFAC